MTVSPCDSFSNLRVIMYHKSPTSARTLFFLQENGVCLPGSLPKLAQLIENGTRRAETEKVVTHPSPFLQSMAEWLDLPQDQLELDDAYFEKVDVAGVPLTIYLARFASIDPPFAAAERVGGRFIALTEGRGLLPTELDLLRRAYSVIMED